MRNLGIGRAIQAPRVWRRGPPMRARSLALRYGIGIAITVVSLFTLILAPIAYFGVGIWLSRYISRHVRWSTIYNNVHDVAEAKSRLIKAWPVEMPNFIWRITLIRHF